MSGCSSRPAGFSILESLIALTLFFFLFLAGIEIFGSARKTLAGLEEAQAILETVSAAMDRIRADVRGAGRGLSGPPGVEIVKSVDADGGVLIVRSGEAATGLTADTAAGQSFLPVEDGRPFPSGRTVCVMDGSKGETAVIASAGSSLLTLEAPLANAYARAETAVVLVQKISLYMDAGRAVLRRRVDAGSGQPLLEDALSFTFSIGSPSPLVTVALRSKLGQGEPYETTIHARNAALSGLR